MGVRRVGERKLGFPGILTTHPQLSPLGNDEERQESDYHRFRAVQLNYFNLNINIESNGMFSLFHKRHILPS